MKFFNEFKKFISRGNVIDLAVGMIIGTAFTAIVTAIVNSIFTPLINLIPISETGLQTVLREAVLDDSGNVKIAALVIDWGAVISAIISFFITAFILFLIVKAANSFRDGSKQLKVKSKKGAVEEVKAPEPAPEPKPTTDELLMQIIELLKEKKLEDIIPAALSEATAEPAEKTE